MSARSTRLSASYHVLVVGNELGGLIYAALAARAGYRVGVLGQGARGGVYRHRGHTFLRQPERFYGFATSAVVARVFGELSMSMEMRNRPRPVEPTAQLVTPDARIDVLRRPERWRGELKRELPDEGRSLLAFEEWAARWTEATNPLLGRDVVLPPTGFRAAARYRQLVGSSAALLDGDERPPSGPATPLVEGALSHLVGLRSRPLAPLALARLWTHVRAGIYRVPGGLDGLKDLFVAKLRDQCGDHRLDAAIEELVVRGRGRVTEVVLAGRGERLGCELLVANMDPRRFLHLIPPDARHDPFHTGLSARVPVAWRLVVNVAVDPRVIPVGMGPEVVLISDPRAPLQGDNCLWISRPGVAPFATGEGRPGPGVLTVTALLPARGIVPGPPAVQRVVAGTLARLRELIPWFDDHVQAVHVPCLIDDPQRPGQAEVDVSVLLPILSDALPMTAGVGALSIDTPYRNILLGGDALFAGLGFEGACLGAAQTLEATRRLVRLKVLRPARS